MATRIYRLCEADHSETLARRRIPQGTEIWDDPNDCSLPHVLCQACRRWAPGGDRDLPESLELSQTHPLMKQLKAIWRRRRKEGRDSHTGLIPPVSWEEYQAVAAEVRSALGLAPDRLLAPCTQLGPHRFLVLQLPLADVDLVPADHLLASPRFVEWLTHTGITGWVAEPVALRFRHKRPEQEPEVLRLRVAGRGGRPANVQGPQVCPVCGGRLNFWYRNPDHLELDERAWDGSGIFSFHGFEYACYVTQAVKDAMETAGFTTVRFKHSPSTQQTGNRGERDGGP